LIEYDFGENSFQRHCERVKKAGARLEIVNLPSLGLDLDVPEDLEIIRSLENNMLSRTLSETSARVENQ
jgi:2-phospho-L-lactate guanylyltransferase (CobY/MobA/RfbA family)